MTLPESAETLPLDAKDERIFLLDEALHFRSTLVDGAIVLAWRDLSGDPGDIYKFICDVTTQPGVSHTFELVGKTRNLTLLIQ
jgi:VID27 N-terminal region